MRYMHATLSATNVYAEMPLAQTRPDVSSPLLHTHTLIPKEPTDVPHLAVPSNTAQCQPKS